ncbi:MAG: hypothetical protein K6G51_07170 [Sphaerochaetaceae bacterium]|nr:hypothetical protein [Sphaerochaetaceae bacterium]
MPTPRRNSRSSDIEIFDAFRKALKELSRRDKELFSSKKNKIAITHRLALYLEEFFISRCVVDICYNIDGYNPDIILHERNGKILLAIWFKDDYLEKALQEEAKRFHDNFGCFTLAFSILSDRDYYLVYRFASTYTDYLHISREDFSENLLKRMREEDDAVNEQLLLDIPKKRTRKKKAKEKANDPNVDNSL